MYRNLLLDGSGEVMRLSWFEVRSTQQVRVMKVGDNEIKCCLLIGYNMGELDSGLSFKAVRGLIMQGSPM